ncbi:MAG: transcription-repair coupling factor [Coriobacteriales bacterium]|jgi:transcription-repair coupling factor (superfamily II helicase)|nr:transcription-repair coupling factor [Coriobacteriales bacterium]
MRSVFLANIARHFFGSDVKPCSSQDTSSLANSTHTGDSSKSTHTGDTPNKAQTARHRPKVAADLQTASSRPKTAAGRGDAPTAPLSMLAQRLDEGKGCNLAVPLSLRPLILATLFYREPRPLFVCVAGEAAARRLVRDTATFLGAERVMQLPLRSDLPWLTTEPNVEQLAARTQALLSLSQGQPAIVVASARSLLRLMPDPSKALPPPLHFTVEQPLPVDYAQLALRLTQMGFERASQALQPGSFALRGDVLDIFIPALNHPLRIEVFDDSVESIRHILPATGQTVGSLSTLSVLPIREFSLSNASVTPSHLPADASPHLELLEQGIPFAGVERYQPYLFEHVGTVLQWIDPRTLVVLAEPRTLFDDAARYFDELEQSAADHATSLEGLYQAPGQLDFDSQQCLTLLSLLASGVKLDGQLKIRHPDINGRSDRLVDQARALLSADFLVFVAQANDRVRKDLMLAFSDAELPFDHSAPDLSDNLDFCQQATTNPDASAASSCAFPHRHWPRLSAQSAHFIDLDIPGSLVVPTAKCALLSLTDIHAKYSSSKDTAISTRPSSFRTQVDPTRYSFPFVPGDYVVHATHGIALFRQIVRRTVDGVERDYLHLEYAKGDKLFTPVEMIDKVSRYVGAEGAAPRLTRLNTADWARVSGKARRAARKLAFDLVDLYARRASVQGFAYPPDNEMQYQMEQRFAYAETPDQLAAIADVKADMQSNRPMDRLICGDVGFGKTEVALRAAFKAVQAGKQVVLLVPTTILAQQHYTTFQERFEPFAVRVEVLSRFKTDAEQNAILEAVADGSVDVLIGTHRLLSADVNPRDLGLVIIDEEQRFGVQHKERLQNLRDQLDVLTLSATPIPRTLQMALSGVRDMSLIDTPPLARTAIEVQVGEWDEDLVSAAIRRELARFGQVYYVSNRVKNIDEAIERVNRAAPEARVVCAHGQLSEQQLEQAMESFAANEADVLVATTIIESGLDNPHTNTLIIEDAQRLGLAQLYQLKGRVGRSHDQAYAYFLFPSEHRLTEAAVERLTAIEEYQELGSGMRVAMRDLEIRGAGSLLGAEQHGNVTAVGFDLFATMLAEAVEAVKSGQLEAEDEHEELAAAAGAKAKAGVQSAAGTWSEDTQKSQRKDADTLREAHMDTRIDVPVHAYLPEEFISATDQRVLFYRRIAAARSLAELDTIAQQLEDRYGGLPAPTVNLLDKARAKTLAAALGISSIAVVRGKLNIVGLSLDSEQIAQFKVKKATYLTKSQKLLYPLKANEPVLPQLLNLLKLLE